MIDWNAMREILRRHDLLRSQPAATPWEGLLFGNADMGAIIYGPAHRLCFRLNKMDLWDARMNAGHYDFPMPLSPFKRFVFDESQKLSSGQVVPFQLNDSWCGQAALYPREQGLGNRVNREQGHSSKARCQ